MAALAAVLGLVGGGGEAAAGAADAAVAASPSRAGSAAALGERLFSDPRLSPDGRFSCASCHRPEAAFAEPGTARHRGRDGRLLPTNTPSLTDLRRRGPFGHVGAAPTLELQARRALLDPNELANPSLAAVAERLGRDGPIAADFQSVYGVAPTRESVVAALAAYLRTLAADTPFDAWLRGEASAMSAAAVRGFELFRGDAGCSACHTVAGARPSLRDDRFHDTGIAARRARRPFDPADRLTQGRISVTGRPSDRYRIGTPSLRGVAATPPYMHDGSIRTLEGVVRYYVAGGARHDGLSPLLSPLPLDDGDVADLVAFLEAIGPPEPAAATGGAVTVAPAE